MRKNTAAQSEQCFHPDWSPTEMRLFNRESKAYIFRSICSFFSTNTIVGDYLEFGCFGGYTMRMAWDYTKNFHKDMRYIAFDTFAGFPHVHGLDEGGHWNTGDLSISEEAFIDIMTRHGIPRDRLTLVKGAFEETCNEETRQRLGGRKASIVYIDCDLYESTIPVLDFIIPQLNRGSVIVFDDWNCFFADDQLGERRAWFEFRRKHPDLRFAEFVQTHLASSFVFLGSGAAD
ncbi:MAG: TylF/MycF/NovP-related O-methyltransferase [Planctomycetota bacterium]